MSYRLVVPSPAEKDFTDALNYYLHISVSTAEKFVGVVEDAYRKIKENPQFYSYFNNSQTARSFHLKPFPYLIIFAIKNDEVIIAALHNAHRDPASVLSRLD